MANAAADELLTLGQVADRVRAGGVDATDHQVKYAIETYRIAPRTRVGILRCWGTDDIPAIRSAVLRVKSNKTGVRHAY